MIWGCLFMDLLRTLIIGDWWGWSQVFLIHSARFFFGPQFRQSLQRIGKKPQVGI
jgi:hypothetical protein